MNLMVQGLSVTVIGMVIVFTILQLISMMMDLLRIVLTGEKKEKSKTETAEEVKIIEAVPEEKAVEEIIMQDDLELVAVITACIAASLNTQVDTLQVRSIKKIKSWIQPGLERMR